MKIVLITIAFLYFTLFCTLLILSSNIKRFIEKNSKCCPSKCKWIDVYEDLPPANVDVIVYTSNGEMFVTSRKESSFYISYWKTKYGDVRYWMPLPNKPVKR